MKKKIKMINKELLRRIDERDYLTEREHREFLERLSKDLEILEYIKSLIKVYNNDEMHFERGFDFINVVKELLDNEK